ncbi:reverse transcriptase domain-containing protein [Tanacetum coccineum]
MIGEGPFVRTEVLDFVIVRSNSPHNLKLERTAMQNIGIVVSTIHRAIKFHTSKGVGTVLSTCEPDKTREGQKKLQEASQEATKDTLSCMIVEEDIVINDKYSDQTIVTGRQLPTSFKKRLRDLLKANVDIFAWTYSDMTGIPRTIMVGGRPFITEHKLNELKHMEPRKQKKRGLAPKRNEALHKEVKELTKANILREVKYLTWVSNPIMIKKGNKKWKLCVDFTDINKACLKDCYPLPTNDQKIESLTKFQLKCFLDAYKGYHQIPMAKGDEEKIAFFIREGVFCYKRLPFGLKYTEATYQRLVDMSDSEEYMLADIQETFDKLRAINMKLNPRKCSFGVEEGPFLGYLIMKQGIKANSSKVKEISDLKPPKMVKEIQSLNDKPAALSRFLPKGNDKTLPFLKEESMLKISGLNSRPPTMRQSTKRSNQVKGLFEARQPVKKQYLEKIREILKSFKSYSMEHVRRDQNKKADALSKLASMTFLKLAKEVLVEVLHEKSIVRKDVMDIIKEEGEN